MRSSIELRDAAQSMLRKRNLNLDAMIFAEHVLDIANRMNKVELDKSASIIRALKALENICVLI